MHISDQELIQSVDGELSAGAEAKVAAHLLECWTCRARKQEIESTIGKLVRARREELPSAEGPRAMLKAQLSAMRATRHSWENWWLAAGVCALLAMGLGIGQWWKETSTAIVVAVPDPKLTPGATVLVSSGELCSASGEKNKAVPMALQRRVFEAYGIRHADPRFYEVDYLITPALGGADDIHNLWPQSYSDTVWNARVKDELEDHLRALVCEGKLDLATAQKEIAENWIEAYKKYFHTERPR
jgi:hypothetical protein